MHEEDNTHMFPIYWTSEPLAIIGYDLDKLSETKNKVVDLLEQFSIMGVRYLLTYKRDLSTLMVFLLI